MFIIVNRKKNKWKRSLYKRVTFLISEPVLNFYKYKYFEYHYYNEVIVIRRTIEINLTLSLINV